MNEIYDFMKEIDVNSELFFNSTTVDYDLADNKELSNQRKGDYLTYLDIESLPTEIWSYSHFPICINYWNTKVLKEDGTDFALGEFGIKYVSEAEFNPRYLRINEGNFPGIPPMDYVMYEKGVSVKALDNAEILAYVVNPYFNRTYDKFCSHRQTPPSEITDEPFIVKSGNTIHISNPLFKDYAINGNMVYKNIIEQCIGRLLDKPILVTDLPSTAELTLRSQDDRFILHALHYIPQRKCRTMDIIEEVIPVYNAEIKVRLDKIPDKVYLAPSLEAIDFKSNNGYVSFKLHELCGHQMVVIE